MLLNGKEIPFDFYSAKTAARYEEALQAIGEKKPPKEGESLSQSIARECAAAVAFFETVFGAETTREILGDDPGLPTCLDAMDALNREVQSQSEALQARIARYRPDRIVLPGQE